MDVSSWEHALAWFYDSEELAHACSQQSRDERDFVGHARVGGANLLSDMLGTGSQINDLPDLDELELGLITFCASLHGSDIDPATRIERCEATITGADAFIRWWGNTLLGLHPEAIRGRSLPDVIDVVAGVERFAARRDKIARRCIAAAEGAAQAITMRSEYEELQTARPSTS